MEKKQAKPLGGRLTPAGAVRLGAGLLFLVLFVALAFFLSQPIEGDAPTAASKRSFAVVRVTDILEDNAQADTWSEGRRLGSQLLEVEVLDGPWKGEILTSPNYLSAYYNIDAKLGTRMVARLAEDDGGQLYIATFVNYDRGLVMGLFVLLFAALLVVIGGKKGLMALLGLAFTLVSIWCILVPLLRRGAPPIPTTIALVAVTAGVSLLLLTGCTRKTLCALLGCVGGVAAAGALAGVVGTITPLNGFNMSEAEELILRAADHGLTVSGLLVCGILISSLGAVMDVAMSIASACNELKELNPKLGRRELLRSGMNIGRDAMGTMANTLILAFAGSSLNMLILFQAYDYPTLQIVNSDLMAIEILQGVAGSIGILLTVPLAASLSAFLYTWEREK